MSIQFGRSDWGREISEKQGNLNTKRHLKIKISNFAPFFLKWKWPQQLKNMSEFTVNILFFFFKYNNILILALPPRYGKTVTWARNVRHALLY